MKIKGILLFFFISLSNFVFPQSELIIDQSRDSINTSQLVDVDKLREEIISSIPDSKILDFERDAFLFADYVAREVKYLTEEGEIYANWDEAQQYANQILDKVLPDGIKEKNGVKAVWVRDASFNAFMTPTGQMFLNVGLFGELKDEASLALIIAHEAAHYIQLHSFERYKKERKGEFKSQKVSKRKARNRFSIENEFESDSIALEWVHKAGYDVNAMNDILDIFANQEKRILGKSLRLFELEETTHPLSENRKQSIQNFINNNPEHKNERYLISEELFKQLQRTAYVEILNELNSNFNYFACAEFAFRLHLNDPQNKDYIYYLIESIRKQCYLDQSRWNKNFLTYPFYDEVEDKWRKKTERKAHIFEHNKNSDILFFSEDEIKNLPTNFYFIGEPKFKTNEEAFNFFIRISQLYKIDECILSNALSFSKNKEARNKLLKEYLSKENIKYRDFASSMLNNTIFSQLEQKKLFLLNSFSGSIRLGNDYVPVLRDFEYSFPPLERIESKIKAFQPNDTVTCIDRYMFGNYQDFIDFKQLQDFSRIPIWSKGERTSLHILEPKIWNILKKNGINEVVFIDFWLVEFRKSDKSLASFISCLDEKEELFKVSKSPRYFEMFMSSVRCLEDGRMKNRYYGGEEKLDKKNDVSSEISLMITGNLKAAEESAKRKDRMWKSYF